MDSGEGNLERKEPPNTIASGKSVFNASTAGCVSSKFKASLNIGHDVLGQFIYFLRFEEFFNQPRKRFIYGNVSVFSLHGPVNLDLDSET